MKRLLDEFAKLFDLGHPIRGIRLGELVESAIDDLEVQARPDWGSPGPAHHYETESGRSLDFHYAPHLFPGMEPSLRLAHKLQFYMLPREVPAAAPVSIAAVLESYCHLSGDLFGWEMLADGRFLIWIVDLSGHGVRAGLSCAVLRVLIDKLGPWDRVESLAMELNETFIGCLREHSGNLFATGFFSILAEDGSADYTSVGHPPVLLRRTGGRIEELSSKGMPIGMFPGRRYTATPIRLEQGDSLLLFTDGVLETVNEKHEFFGLPRIRRLLQAEHGAPRSVTDALYREIADFKDMDKLDDDVTFVAARFAPASKPAPAAG